MNQEQLRQDYMLAHNAYFDAVRDSKPLQEIEALRAVAHEKQRALKAVLPEKITSS
jgi:uncharacterized protein (UPF0262 family)